MNYTVAPMVPESPPPLDTLLQTENLLDGILERVRPRERPTPELMDTAERWARAVWTAAEQLGPAELQLSDRRVGLALAARPVFICGAHRSGTTLVRNLLDGHPQLSVLPSEGSYFTNWRSKLQTLPPQERRRAFGAEWVRRLANPENQLPFWLLGRSSPATSPYVEFARFLNVWWNALEETEPHSNSIPLRAIALAYASCRNTRSSDLRWWVDKTPGNERHLAAMLSEYPAAKVIHVVRHPYEVYASRKQLETAVFGALHTPRKVLQDLGFALEIAAKHDTMEFNSAHLVLRYEDILKAPEPIAELMARFLSIDNHAALLSPTIAGRPAFPNTSFAGSTTPGQIIPPAPAPALSKEEVQAVAAYTATAARSFGYSVRRLSNLEVRRIKVWLWLADTREKVFRRLWKRRRFQV